MNNHSSKTYLRIFPLTSLIFSITALLISSDALACSWKTPSANIGWAVHNNYSLQTGDENVGSLTEKTATAEFEADTTDKHGTIAARCGDTLDVGYDEGGKWKQVGHSQITLTADHDPNNGWFITEVCTTYFPDTWRCSNGWARTSHP